MNLAGHVDEGAQRGRDLSPPRIVEEEPLEGRRPVLQHPDQIAWVLTSYIIAAAIMTPPTGFLTGRLRLKRPVGVVFGDGRAECHRCYHAEAAHLVTTPAAVPSRAPTHSQIRRRSCSGASSNDGPRVLVITLSVRHSVNGTCICPARLGITMVLEVVGAARPLPGSC